MLYAITDTQLLPGEKLFAAVAAALNGGCRRVQYRDKILDAEFRYAQASRLSQLCRAHDAQLIINDDIHLAKAVGAAGVHLGQSDTGLKEARMYLGPDVLLGATCHDSLALAQQAINEGADYVAFGRFFSSITKPEAPPAPLSLLREARQMLGDVPIVAIGGITLENAPSVLSAGADWIAVSHSLFSADDIKERAAAFCQIYRILAGSSVGETGESTASKG